MEKSQNYVELWGTAGAAPSFSHENHGESFYRFPLRVERLSGQSDLPLILAPSTLLEGTDIAEGTPLRVTGQLRSFNNRSGHGPPPALRPVSPPGTTPYASRRSRWATRRCGIPFGSSIIPNSRSPFRQKRSRRLAFPSEPNEKDDYVLRYAEHVRTRKNHYACCGPGFRIRSGSCLRLPLSEGTAYGETGTSGTRKPVQ